MRGKNGRISRYNTVAWGCGRVRIGMWGQGCGARDPTHPSREQQLHSLHGARFGGQRQRRVAVHVHNAPLRHRWRHRRRLRHRLRSRQRRLGSAIARAGLLGLLPFLWLSHLDFGGWRLCRLGRPRRGRQGGCQGLDVTCAPRARPEASERRQSCNPGGKPAAARSTRKVTLVWTLAIPVALVGRKSVPHPHG